MKKETITPEEYSNILSSISLSQILLNDCSAKKHEVKSKGGAIDLDISMKLGYDQNASEVSFITTYKLEGIKRSEGTDEKVFSITASFLLSYMKTKEVEVSKEFVNVFKNNSIELVSWPYFREFVQNMISRMGFPPLTLPSKFFSK
jgi:preprotein translocase subunit SecB